MIGRHDAWRDARKARLVLESRASPPVVVATVVPVSSQFWSRDLKDLRSADSERTFETASALGLPAAAEAGMLYRYETADGRVVYSNLPIDKLSVTVREMLAESQ